MNSLESILDDCDRKLSLCFDKLEKAGCDKAIIDKWRARASDMEPEDAKVMLDEILESWRKTHIEAQP